MTLPIYMADGTGCGSGLHYAVWEKHPIGFLDRTRSQWGVVILDAVRTGLLQHAK